MLSNNLNHTSSSQRQGLGYKPSRLRYIHQQSASSDLTNWASLKSQGCLVRLTTDLLSHLLSVSTHVFHVDCLSPYRGNNSQWLTAIHHHANLSPYKAKKRYKVDHIRDSKLFGHVLTYPHSLERLWWRRRHLGPSKESCKLPSAVRGVSFAEPRCTALDKHTLICILALARLCSIIWPTQTSSLKEGGDVTDAVLFTMFSFPSPY